MEIFLLIILMLILAIISGKAFYNMPNPGKRFYNAIHKDETNNKNNQ